MPAPTRIRFWGNFGTGNWGNECTLQAILYHARRRLPDAELSCICSEPDDTTRRHRVAAFPIGHSRRMTARAPSKRRPLPLRVVRRLSAELKDWAEALRLARESDSIIMTGTGMLTDTSEGAFGLPYDLFRWAVLAKLCGAKLTFTSVGVEPIHNRVSKFFILTALRLADYRSYRDQQSRDHLSRLGFATTCDAVYPDLAFSLAQSWTARSSPAAQPRPKVAVGLYAYRSCGARGPSDMAAYRTYLDKIGRFVMWLLERGHGVRLIIGDLTYDEPVLNDIRAWLEREGVARYRDRLEDKAAACVEDVISQLADVDVVVASRFHNVLLALLLGKPTLSISYNEKNDALMGQMGLSAYCQPIDDFAVDRLIEQFADLEGNAARVAAETRDKGASFRHELERQYDAVFGSGPGKHTVQ